ncbi:MAG: NAD-dependent protein deacylase [Christensenellaceae bacterium]|nr:NAD-dependent protein deacylase [Christensenellaceae bacterium]
MSSTQSLQELVDKSRRIVFFGGAGVSTESGIPDFRSAGGLYGMKYKYQPETMLSHSFFVTHPEEFFEFYRSKILYPDARPNKAHLKLAEMEKAGKLTAVVTQNIDGLHQMAGSQNVLELHGSVHRNYCMKCRAKYGLEFILHSTGVPRCKCGGMVRPDVVLYEEPLDGDVMYRAAMAISKADLVIVGGTSLVVYPAAGLLSNYDGALVLINKSATPYDSRAQLVIREPIGETLGALTV